MFQKIISSSLARFALVAVAPLVLQAQTTSPSGISDRGGRGASIFSVGTAKQIGAQQWAYVIWQPSEAGLIEGQRFAIYRKAGAAVAPGTYLLQGDVQPSLSAAAITQALSTAVTLGEDLEDLEHGLGALLKADRDDLSIEEKALAVIQAAIDDKSVLQRLHVMSRVHPAISLMMGLAYAQPLPGPGLYTYEIRLIDEDTGLEAGVMGRVQVNTTVTPLPAPIALYTFFEPNERGHLNAKLRWANPPDLRLRALEHYGYNIYRVAKADAVARGWNLTRSGPATTALLAAVGDNSNPRFKRVNEVPVLTESDLDAMAASNAADLKTYFFADDNGRFDPEDPKPPLADGDEFFYYVAALDVLGRDGLISVGRLTSVYDTYPPEAPRELGISNEYKLLGATRRQFLRLSWEAPPVDEDGADLDEYLIYRWNSDRDITASNKAVASGAALPAAIGVVKHVPGTRNYQFDDTGAGAPNAATAGKTFWYTVRARDLSKRPGGGNLSGNSVPVFGVIRDRQGPQAASGLIRLSCVRPLVSADGQLGYSSPTNQAQVTLLCTAPLDSGLAWAEFSIPGVSILGQYAMRSDGAVLVAKVILPASYFYTQSKTQEVRVSCRVATHSGRISTLTSQTLPTTLGATEGRLVKFKGETQLVTGILGDPLCGFRHEVYSGGLGPNTRSSLCGELSAPIPLGTREYKIYRRVANGPLTLVDFGPKKTTTGPGAITPGFNQVLDLTRSIDWCDRTVPSGVSNLCYFVQTFDEHGNASPMASLGCIESVASLSAPTLLPLEPAKTSVAPEMTIRWFGSPHEATRYEVFISRDGEAYTPPPSTTLPADLSADLSPLDSSGARIAQRVLGDVAGDFSAHETPQVRILLGAAAIAVEKDSLFSVRVPVVLGCNYKVVVRAVGPGHLYGARAMSPLSNVQDFVWAPAPGALPQVPWPARLGAATQASTGFHADLQAQNLEGRVPDFKGIGVRIGAVDMPLSNGQPVPTQLDDPQLKDRYTNYPRPVNGFAGIGRSLILGKYNPLTAVFAQDTLAQTENSLGPVYAGKILPVLLYRYEVVAGLNPTVVQVTPLMEEIAYEEHSTGNTVIHDPWVAVVPRLTSTSYSKTHEMFLLDRSPVTSGSKYRYVLVRFNKRTMEIERVLETPVVNVP